MVSLFENVEKGNVVRSVPGSQRALMALLTAQEINSRTDILPSFQVTCLFRFELEHCISNAFKFGLMPFPMIEHVCLPFSLHEL